MWTIGDILDYEVLLSGGTYSESEAQRRRNWYREYSGRRTPRRLLLTWLEEHRRTEDVSLPGKTVNRLYTAGLAVMALVGVISGAGLGWGVLSYAGSDAVNLLVTLALLVGLPLVMTLVSFVLSILPAKRDRTLRIVDRLNRVINGSVAFGRRLGIIDRAQSDAVVSSLSRFRDSSSRYGVPARWFLNVLLQVRALCFHIGIFISVLWRGLIQDLAFAWQTTLQVIPERVHYLAVRIAWPWRLIVPTPTAEQVAGSRVVLKEGIAGLDNGDLIAWWPYVCCAIVAYGVLPRLILLVYALLCRFLSLLSLPFSDSRSRRFLADMKSSGIHVSGTESPAESSLPSSAGPEVSELPDSTIFRVLVPSSRNDLNDIESWKSYLAERFQVRLFDITPVSMDDEDDLEILKTFNNHPSRYNAVLVVFEGWRPYTAAAALYIDAIRSYVSGDIPVIAALSGRRKSGIPDPHDDSDTLKQWLSLLPTATESGNCEILMMRGWT